jgi:hypothetical protein
MAGEGTCKTGVPDVDMADTCTDNADNAQNYASANYPSCRSQKWYFRSVVVLYERAAGLTKSWRYALF